MTYRLRFAASLAAVALASCTTMADSGTSSTYTAAGYSAALADPARPADQRASDAARLPGELLAFAQIDRGEEVGDYIMGAAI